MKRSLIASFAALSIVAAPAVAATTAKMADSKAAPAKVHKNAKKGLATATAKPAKAAKKSN